MSETSEVWILLQPSEDYGEEPEILGVYPTLEAAQAAPEVLDAPLRPRWVNNVRHDVPRMREAQLWRGSQHVDTWLYFPQPKEWEQDDHSPALRTGRNPT